MKPINNYKKCFCCGRKYRADAKETNCSCGGFLYMIGTIYQEKVKGANDERKN